MNLYRCTDCGDSMRTPADTQQTFVQGTASTRVRSTRHYCAECHAANEYKRHAAVQAYAAEIRVEARAAGLIP